MIIPGTTQPKQDNPSIARKMGSDDSTARILTRPPHNTVSNREATYLFHTASRIVQTSECDNRKIVSVILATLLRRYVTQFKSGFLGTALQASCAFICSRTMAALTGCSSLGSPSSSSSSSSSCKRNNTPTPPGSARDRGKAK